MNDASLNIKNENLTTENKILLAAEEIFMREGYNGSRMQDIADLAGINKALLHYYFRSKDKLFEQIFDKKASALFPQLEELFVKENSFCEVLCTFIEIHIKLLIENPFLPLFVISTINKPDGNAFIQRFPRILNLKLIEKYNNDLAAGKVKQLNPMQFLVSVLAMNIFPFLAKPMLKDMANFDEEQFNWMMQNRIAEVQMYVKSILEVNTK